jgi:hypothetical protein
MDARDKGEELADEHVTLLKAYGMFDADQAEEAGDDEVYDGEGEPADEGADEGEEGEGEGEEADGPDDYTAGYEAGLAAARGESEEGTPLQKAYSTRQLQEIPDPPAHDELLADIHAEGGDEAVDASPVLKALIANQERIAAALEANAVAVTAQNELLAQVVPVAQRVEEVGAAVAELQKAIKPIRRLASSDADRNPLLKAMQANVGSDLEQRLAGLEGIMTDRGWSGNPPRGELFYGNGNGNGNGRGRPLLKAVVGGDVGYGDAQTAIKRSSLADHDKAEALGNLDVARDMGRPYSSVLEEFGVTGSEG